MTPVEESLAKRVRAALQAVPLRSLRKIARAAGISHSTLSLIYRGKRGATPEMAAAIAQGLEAVAQEEAARYTNAARVIRAQLRRSP